jgi:hypothetical protein
MPSTPNPAHDDYGMPKPLSDSEWDIRRNGREWEDEAHERFELTRGKIEMYEGKLFWEDSERVTMLALLLENLGADRAVRLGNPAVWRAAIEALGGGK